VGVISLLLADDHTVVCQGLWVLLQAQPDPRIVGEAADGQEAICLANELQPDVVLVDLAMPGTNGIEATRAILQKSPAVKVLILSSCDMDE